MAGSGHGLYQLGSTSCWLLAGTHSIEPAIPNISVAFTTNVLAILNVELVFISRLLPEVDSTKRILHEVGSKSLWEALKKFLGSSKNG